MPLHRRLPKRGFTNVFRKEYAVVNVGSLERLEGDVFDPASLSERGVVKKLRDGLKILGGGELTRKVTVKAHLFSKAAEEKIKAAGGSVERIGAEPVEESR
jgi:large subunit ribosomal protein L15